MTDPSSPSYQLTQADNWAQYQAAEHTFEPPEATCSKVLFRLESGWPIQCGLPRSKHPVRVRAFPSDEAQGT